MSRPRITKEQLQRDRDVLAAEVRLWRVFNDTPDTVKEAQIGRVTVMELCYRFGGRKALEQLHDRCAALNAAKAATDASGALDRAKSPPPEKGGA